MTQPFPDMEFSRYPSLKETLPTGMQVVCEHGVMSDLSAKLWRLLRRGSPPSLTPGWHSGGCAAVTDQATCASHHGVAYSAGLGLGSSGNVCN